MVVPQSVIGARDAARARAAVDERATLRDMWAPDRHVFAAKVHVCVLALQMRDEPTTGSARLNGGEGSWPKDLARSKAAPVLELTGGQHHANLPTPAAGSRDGFYTPPGH